MSSRDHHDVGRKSVATRKAGSNGAATPLGERASGGPAPRVRSDELLNDGAQLIIEHAGREYRLRVTSKGKLILTA